MRNIEHPGLPAIRKVNEYKVYVASGRDVSATARVLGKARNTVMKWREEEYWDDHANLDLDALGKEVQEQHQSDNAEALEDCKSLAKRMRRTADKLMERLEEHAAHNMVDALDISASFRAGALAISENARIYGWERLKLELGGKVEVVGLSPESQQRVEEARRKMREQEAQA